MRWVEGLQQDYIVLTIWMLISLSALRETCLQASSERTLLKYIRPQINDLLCTSHRAGAPIFDRHCMIYQKSALYTMCESSNQSMVNVVLQGYKKSLLSVLNVKVD